MTINVEKFAAQHKAAVDSLLAVATAAMSSAERIAALNLSTGREFVQDYADAAKAVLNAKDPQEALATASGLVQPSIQKAVAYSKSLYEIGAEAQNEVQKLFESQYSDFQAAATKLIDEAAKSAPAGSEAIIAAAKDAVAKASTALETAKQIANNFVESAQSAAMANATSATKAAARKSK
jgi:phasin family protein